MTRGFIALILLLHWSQGTEGGDDVIQEPDILWEPKSSSAYLSCKHNKDISYRQMYWYRQRPGETMTLIVFTMAGSIPEFGDVDEKKFEAQKSDAKSGSLKVKDLEPDDSAIYFCAVRVPGQSNTAQAHFGEGTKLTVLDPDVTIKKPDVKILKEIHCKEKVTLVCLAENFYPDHVSIKWTLRGNEITEDVATDPYATQDETTKMFHISSRLKVSKKIFTPKNTFKCIVTFYSATDVSEEESADITGTGGGGYEPEDYLKSSQTMKLAYGVFIAKSALYGLVIFVFMWRKGSSGK